jgi:hypothetical protein
MPKVVPFDSQKRSARFFRSAHLACFGLLRPASACARPQAPLRYPEPSPVRSPTPLSEQLCRPEERRELCPCKPKDHKFSDL